MQQECPRIILLVVFNLVSGSTAILPYPSRTSIFQSCPQLGGFCPPAPTPHQGSEETKQVGGSKEPRGISSTPKILALASSLFVTCALLSTFVILEMRFFETMMPVLQELHSHNTSKIAHTPGTTCNPGHGNQTSTHGHTAKRKPRDAIT